MKENECLRKITWKCQCHNLFCEAANMVVHTLLSNDTRWEKSLDDTNIPDISPNSFFYTTDNEIPPSLPENDPENPWWYMPEPEE